MSESPKKTYFGHAFIYLFTFQTQQSATFGKCQQVSGGPITKQLQGQEEYREW